MFGEIWSYVVWFIHISFVLFMVITPFTHRNEYILLHIILVPFLYFHWLTNNDTCALTELEKYLSNKKVNSDTFIGSIMSPIYIINDCKMQKITKMMTLLLWCLTLQKVT